MRRFYRFTRHWWEREIILLLMLLGLLAAGGVFSHSEIDLWLKLRLGFSMVLVATLLSWIWGRLMPIVPSWEDDTNNSS